MASANKTQKQLRELADYLRLRREAILSGWRAATDADPDLTSGASFSRTQFIDHIPEFLDTYETRLRCWPDEVPPLAKQRKEFGVRLHGLHRWQQGYRLRELTREWGHFQFCLIDEVEKFASEHSELEPNTVSIALRMLSQMCIDGVSDSTAQYWELQQMEAAGHVHDLEEALSTLEEVERARANAWHQAAHDLRGGLTVLRVASHILSEEDVPEAARAQSAAMLQRSVASLHEMLTDLVDLARLEAGHEKLHLTEFDAADLLRSLCANIEPLARESDLYLKCDGPETLPVEGDRPKVQRIAQNLLLNAVKYTSEGGVEVHWSRCAENETPRWQFSVRDTGPGFDTGPAAPLADQLVRASRRAQELKECAEPPGTANPEGQLRTLPTQGASNAKTRSGEGIGLSIVKGLCDLLNATLELETQPGQGSTLRVTLPVRY
jgi:signal transduction histidine kinase